MTIGHVAETYVFFWQPVRAHVLVHMHTSMCHPPALPYVLLCQTAPHAACGSRVQALVAP